MSLIKDVSAYAVHTGWRPSWIYRFVGRRPNYDIYVFAPIGLGWIVKKYWPLVMVENWDN